MIDFLAPTARQRNIEINWFPAADLPPVRLDSDLFEQALLNLMLNAEQAMPEGGSLTIIGRSSDGPAPDTWCTEPPSASSDGRLVYLDVIDTGLGIEPEAMAKLFRPFHTTKPDGNGLGLATTRKIVRAHGGTIDVQSTPGRGTKFTIALPAAAETAE
jgi:signal transduction histidine kinase